MVGLHPNRDGWQRGTSSRRHTAGDILRGTYSRGHTAGDIQRGTYSGGHIAGYIQQGTYSRVHTAGDIQQGTYSRGIYWGGVDCRSGGGRRGRRGTLFPNARSGLREMLLV